MFQTFNCNDNCCVYKISNYKHTVFNNSTEWKSNSGKIVKAGSFIVDPSNSKILLVQSRGQLWGPPKGTIQSNETYEDCAIREVLEETGIKLLNLNFIGHTIVKNKAMYYTTELKECEVSPQTHIKDNDANGIGWFNINCLLKLVENNKIYINQHCKILIKKFFRTNKT